MTSSSWLVVPMLGVLFASADALAGSKEDARAHVAKATRAHKEARYEDARVELEAAYALDPKPPGRFGHGETIRLDEFLQQDLAGMEWRPVRGKTAHRAESLNGSRQFPRPPVLPASRRSTPGTDR